MIDANMQKYLAFVKTAELKSFSLAGEALGYSQSGISRMIHDLESEWGLTLMERDRSGVRLTSDGIRLLPWAEKLCRAFFEMEQKVSEVNGLMQGLVRIGAFSSVATHWLPPMIQKFQKDYPGIDYEILIGDYEEVEAWVASGRVDCGFSELPERSRFDPLFVVKDELMVILPENHPLTRYDAIPLKALSEAPFLLLEKRAPSSIIKIFETYHVKQKIKLTTWDDPAMMSMVEHGIGISIEPKLILQRVPYHIAIRPLEEPAYREISLVMKDKKHAPAAMKRFLPYMLDFLREISDQGSVISDQ